MRNGYPRIPYVSVVGMITCNDSQVDCNEGSDKKTGTGGLEIADDTPNTGTALRAQSVNIAL